jgi:outer membrane protein OmpA-like peptidoglycan-associated protein
MTRKDTRRISSVILLITFVAISSIMALADSTKVEGVIKGRSGEKIILQTKDSPKVIVVLTDSTDVAQVQGMLKARKKEMSMAALIPGLPVKVEGDYNDKKELVATKVRFKGNDLQQAQAIQAGLAETKSAAQQNTAELEKQQAALAEQERAMTEEEKKVAENKAGIAANSARFGELNDYYIIDQVTVLFPNGSDKIDEKYNPELIALAQKAKSVNGYMIEVKGYASTTGSASVNQKLSEERASGVTSVLLQDGHVPLTNMLAPGAMGESGQIEKSDNAVENEAANRRVVVRILQNKAVAGVQSSSN